MNRGIPLPGYSRNRSPEHLGAIPKTTIFGAFGNGLQAISHSLHKFFILVDHMVAWTHEHGSLFRAALLDKSGNAEGYCRCGVFCTRFNKKK